MLCDNSVCADENGISVSYKAVKQRYMFYE